MFSRVFRNFQPGNKRIQADLKKMQEELEELSADLAPLGLEELEAVSYSQVRQTARKRFVTTGRGVFTTIYHEPVIAYSYKNYAGSKVQSLVFAKTAKYQLAYLVRKKGVQIVINNKLAGTFREEEGKLYDAKQKKVRASMKPGPEGIFSVTVGEREVGSLAQRRKEKEVLSQRALAFIKPDMSELETRLFLAIVIFRMVQSVTDVYKSAPE